MKQELPPKNKINDYSREAIDERIKWLEARNGISLKQISQFTDNPDIFKHSKFNWRDSNPNWIMWTYSN